MRKIKLCLLFLITSFFCVILSSCDFIADFVDNITNNEESNEDENDNSTSNTKIYSSDEITPNIMASEKGEKLSDSEITDLANKLKDYSLEDIISKSFTASGSFIMNSNYDDGSETEFYNAAFTLESSISNHYFELDLTNTDGVSGTMYLYLTTVNEKVNAIYKTVTDDYIDYGTEFENMSYDDFYEENFEDQFTITEDMVDDLKTHNGNAGTLANLAYENKIEDLLKQFTFDNQTGSYLLDVTYDQATIKFNVKMQNNNLVYFRVDFNGDFDGTVVSNSYFEISFVNYNNTTASLPSNEFIKEVCKSFLDSATNRHYSLNCTINFDVQDIMINSSNNERSILNYTGLIKYATNGYYFKLNCDGISYEVYEEYGKSSKYIRAKGICDYWAEVASSDFDWSFINQFILPVSENLDNLVYDKTSNEYKGDISFNDEQLKVKIAFKDYNLDYIKLYSDEESDVYFNLTFSDYGNTTATPTTININDLLGNNYSIDRVIDSSSGTESIIMAEDIESSSNFSVYKDFAFAFSSIDNELTMSLNSQEEEKSFEIFDDTIFVYDLDSSDLTVNILYTNGELKIFIDETTILVFKKVN